MKILLVEDEKKTAGFLRKGLMEKGFSVDVAGDGEHGLRLARAGNYDLLLLDVMLPRRDGWSILSELRNEGRQTPVLFVTAKDAVPSRVKGLELGADDYLIKPFAFSELLARIRSVMRRRSASSPDSLCVGDLELDFVGHKATRSGKRLELTPKEFALLALLARHKGEILSRPMIAEQVWDMRYEGETNVVDVHVRRLRSKVDDPFPQKLIHTVRGAGYVFQEPE
jgi:two-component system, OmpR family, copper resistance phosphate regulon response regulator CusR